MSLSVDLQALQVSFITSSYFRRGYYDKSWPYGTEQFTFYTIFDVLAQLSKYFDQRMSYLLS